MPHAGSWKEITWQLQNDLGDAESNVATLEKKVEEAEENYQPRK